MPGRSRGSCPLLCGERNRVPSDAAALHPIVNDRSLSQVTIGVLVTFAVTAKGGERDAGGHRRVRDQPGCIPRSRWRGGGTKLRSSIVIAGRTATAVGPQGRDAVSSPALLPSAGGGCAPRRDARALARPARGRGGAGHGRLAGPASGRAPLPTPVTFERVLRCAAGAQPGITVRTGHADEVSRERGRATGVSVDRHQVAADLVIDASGRASRLTRAFRGPAEGGDCGIAHVSRQYRLLPGAAYRPTMYRSG